MERPSRKSFTEQTLKQAARMRRRLSSFLEADASEELTPMRRDTLNSKFEAMLARHEANAKHFWGLKKGDDSTSGEEHSRREISLRYTVTEKRDMLLFSRTQYSTTGIGCVYLVFSILLVYVEDEYSNVSNDQENSLYIILVILYAVLCVLLVLAVVSIYYAFRSGGHSRTICRLLFTLGRTWRIFLLLTVRLAVGIAAFCLGAPLHTMLNGMAIFVLGAALVLQDVLTIRYSHKILTVWVCSFTFVMGYTWAQSLLDKQIDSLANPIILGSLKYDTFVRTIYSSLFGVMFDGLIVIMKDVERKQFVWIIKRKFRSDVPQMTVANETKLSSMRAQFYTKQRVAILACLGSIVFYAIGIDTIDSMLMPGDTKIIFMILYFVCSAVLIVAFLSMFYNNFSPTAFKLLFRERHLVMVFLYCTGLLVMHCYVYWPHSWGGWPSVIKDTNGTIVQEGYGELTDGVKLLNITQSLLFLIQALFFLSMDALIVRSPFLVASVAILGVSNMLQHAIRAAFSTEYCYVMPNMSVTQCSIEVSIYTSMCMIFSSSIYCAVRDLKFKRFLFIHEAVYCRTMTNSPIQRDLARLKAPSVQRMKRLSAMSDWQGNLDSVVEDIPIVDEAMV
eukprot:g5615.t1